MKNQNIKPIKLGGKTYTFEGMRARYETAMALRQKPDRDAITKCIKEAMLGLTTKTVEVEFVETLSEIGYVARNCQSRSIQNGFYEVIHGAQYRQRQFAIDFLNENSTPLSNPFDVVLAQTIQSLRNSLPFPVHISSGRNGGWETSGAFVANGVAIYVLGSLAIADEVKFAKILPLFEAFEHGLLMQYMDDKVTYAIEIPRHYSLNERNQFHNPTDVAFSWLNINEYMLNGVLMQKRHVMSSAHELNPLECLSEPNTDVRRELVRKIGIEMLLSHLTHRVLNSQGEYELLSVDIPGLMNDARYLKMKNPSIGVWHMEGVERECNTVQEALNWRAAAISPAKEDWKPSQLT